MIPRTKITIIPLSGRTEFDDILIEAVQAWNDEHEDPDEREDRDDDNGPIGDAVP